MDWQGTFWACYLSVTATALLAINIAGKTWPRESWTARAWREYQDRESAAQKRRFDFWNRLAEYGDGSTGKGDE